MKKFLAIGFILSALPAYSFDSLPSFTQSTILPMHDMQSIETQRFRQEQLDYYNDINVEKKKFEKRNKTAEQKTQEVKEQIQQAVDRKYNSMGQSQFVQENGKWKIKYGN